MNVVDILSNLVAFETVNNPAENIKPNSEILFYIKEEILEKLGYKTYLFEKNGYNSLIAYITPRPGPKILFLGHCDVVPPGPNWNTNPFDFTIKEGYGYGRGTADMKGSVAVMLSIAKTLANTDKGNVIFSFTLDEESGGVYGAGQLIKHLKRLNLLPDYVINGDANGLQIVTKRRNPYVISLIIPKRVSKIKGKIGMKTFQTKIAGDRTMHAAYFMKDLDRHCATEASKFIKEKRFLVKSIRGTFVKNNVIPQEIDLEYIEPNDGTWETYDENLTKFLYAVEGLQELDFPSKPSDYGINLTFNYYREEKKHHFIQLDLRIMSKKTKTIKSILQEYFKNNNVSGKIIVEGSIGPVMTPESSTLVVKALKVAENMQLPSKVIEMGGATDSRWFSAKKIPTIEFGPLGKNVHGANEAVEIKSLNIVEAFYLNIYTALVS